MTDSMRQRVGGRLTNTMDIKRQNLASTFRCILGCERISLMDLTNKLSLSGTSVLQNVKTLGELGLLHEAGSYESTGGRKAKAYAPVNDARFSIGIDLTRNHASVVLINLAGQIKHFQRERIPFSLDDDYLLHLGEIAERISDQYGEKVLGAGISIPGIVDNEAGMLRFSHVLDIRDIPTNLFSRHIPFQCNFINDANAAGLAEVYGNDAPGLLAYLSLSSSVGGAILKDGRIYSGQKLRAGEFGHMTLIPGGRLCYCGKQGCLDAYCSAGRLADMAGGNLEDFFTQIEAGDPVKLNAWKECLEYLAIAVNNINMIFDCDVIIGGYLGAHMEKFGGDLLPLLAGRNTFDNDVSYVRFCHYKKEASAVGAALTHVNSFITSLSLP